MTDVRYFRMMVDGMANHVSPVMLVVVERRITMMHPERKS